MKKITLAILLLFLFCTSYTQKSDNSKLQAVYDMIKDACHLHGSHGYLYSFACACPGIRVRTLYIDCDLNNRPGLHSPFYCLGSYAHGNLWRSPPWYTFPDDCSLDLLEPFQENRLQLCFFLLKKTSKIISFVLLNCLVLKIPKFTLCELVF